MNVYELWRARIEGRFGLKHYAYAWIVSARPFAAPWVALFTLFGALLAGVSSFDRAIASCAVSVLLLLASHFNNNYRDVELGIDRYVDSPDEAERIISSVKPYTAASWLVPLRITGTRFQKSNEALMIALAIVTYLKYFHNDVEILMATLPVLALGVALARTYTSVFKRRGLGELAVFLGHGFGTSALGYLSQRVDPVNAVLVAIPTGLISALAYSVDQFVDIRTDFVRRVRSMYESWFNSRMPLGLYVLISVSMWLNIVVAWVAAGIYPRGVLLVLSIVPLALFLAPQLEYDRHRALRNVALLCVVLVPVLMCLGAVVR
ncbi:MAG: hypothetical protein QXU69_04600 [Thermofilaceae archaeon]